MMRVRRHPRVSGMALIAVLWIVAALSVLVTGMAQTVHQQVRITGAARDEVAGQAIGEAAIALAVQALQVSRERPRQAVQLTQQFDGVDVPVRVMPLTGLISLNGANVRLFASALKVAGGLDAGAADALAQAIVEWRDETVEGGSRHLFEAVEDLLLVPGIDYGLYVRLRPLFTAAVRAGGVNPLAAPLEVLTVLADGNAARAGDIAARRDAGEPGIDTTALDPALVSAAATDEYRLLASVPLGAGKILLLTRDVGLRPVAAGAPWRVFGTMRQVVTTSAS